MSSGWDEQARMEKLVAEFRAENKRLREKYRIQTEARATAELRASDLVAALRECQKCAQLPPTDSGYALKARVEILIGSSQSDAADDHAPP